MVVLQRNPVVQSAIGGAIEVHRTLGPGLLETVYRRSLEREFQLRGLSCQLEVPLPVAYKGVDVNCGYRLDFLVGKQLVIEVKSVERLLPIHEAQVITCLRLSGARQALLINFNVPRLVDGLKSFLA
jgi:GxxExxY protein